MSADNWAICPRCVHNQRQEIQRVTDEVNSQYGKVSLDEWQILRDSIPYALGDDLDDFQTFREDYEFYGAEEGELQISYSGTCTKCGLTLKVKDSRKFWP